MFTLKLLGGACVEGPEGPLTGRVAQRRRLAVLALLAMSRRQGLGREKLAATLWPESDGDRARHLLSDTVYVINRALGSCEGDVITAAAGELRLRAGALTCDARAFEDAVDSGALEDAVRLYTGPFLDGFFVDGSEEFERWTCAERERLHDLYSRALERLATTRAERDDLRGALEAWRRLAAADPLNSRVACRVAATLDRTGDRAGALMYLQTHIATLKEELGIAPPGDVTTLLRALRAAPPGAGAHADTEARAAFAVDGAQAEGVQAEGVQVKDLQPASAAFVMSAAVEAALREAAWNNQRNAAATRANGEQNGADADGQASVFLVEIPLTTPLVMRDGGPPLSGLPLAAALQKAALTEIARIESGRLEPARVDPGRSEPGCAAPVRAEPGHIERGRVEPGRVEPRRVDLACSEAVLVGSERVEARRSESGRPERGPAEPAPAEPGGVEPERVGAARVASGCSESGPPEPRRVEPEHVEPGRGECWASDPGRSESGSAERGRAEFGHVEAGRPESVHVESGRAEPGRDGRGRAEPVRIAVARVESAPLTTGQADAAGVDFAVGAGAHAGADAGAGVDLDVGGVGAGVGMGVPQPVTPADVVRYSGRDRRKKRPIALAAMAGIAAVGAIVSLTLIVALLRGWPKSAEALTTTRAVRSVAVMPFADLSPARDHEYFGEGTAEELSTRLAQVPGLKVAARGSAFAFKDGRTDAKEIGRALNVDALLEGSVRQEKGRVRIAVRLVDARDGYQMWADTWECDGDKVLAMQDDIATDVLAVLRAATTSTTAGKSSTSAAATSAALAPSDLPAAATSTSSAAPALAAISAMNAKAATTSTSPVTSLSAAASASASAGARSPSHSRPRSSIDLAAYNLYLQGRYFWHQRTHDGLTRAAALFDRAAAISPNYAEAHSGVADAYAVLGFYDHLPPREAFPRAKAAARRALELDDRLAAAYASLGYVALYYDWDWAAAEREFARAVELNPSYSIGHQWRGNYLVARGRFDEAEAAMRRAQEIDPLSLIASAALCWVQFHARKFDAAAQQCQRTIEMNPNFVQAWQWGGSAHEGAGRYAEAIRMLKRATELSNRSAITMIALGRAYALSGDIASARRIADSLRGAGAGYVPPYELAKLHLALGDRAEALTSLRHALSQRSHSIVFLAVDPQLDPLRNDPEFHDLLMKSGVAK